MAELQNEKDEENDWTALLSVRLADPKISLRLEENLLKKCPWDTCSKSIQRVQLSKQ